MSGDDPLHEMETLMAKIESARKSLHHKEREIERLAGQQQLRPPQQESDSARELRQDVGKREQELEELTRTVQAKEREHSEQLRRLEQVEGAVGRSTAQDEMEEAEIAQLRQQNSELQVQIRHCQKDIHLAEAQEKTMRDRLQEKQQQAAEAEQRAAENSQREQKFGAKLNNLDSLKRQYEESELLVTELNEIVEQMDLALELMDSAVETARVEHEVSKFARRDEVFDQHFESSPALKCWLGSAASATATIKAVQLGHARGQQWVQSDQVEAAKNDV